MINLRSSKSFGSSRLFDQDSFYLALDSDLRKAKQQVVIESPFITTKRMKRVLPILRELRRKNVQVIVNTKPIDEHETNFSLQAANAIAQMQQMGVMVLLTVGHHRKLAIIDNCITWEGSLNIFSQNDSCEIMRRIDSKTVASETLSFLKLKKFLR